MNRVRDGQHNLAAFLELVSRGQEIAVTKRGRVIADGTSRNPGARPRCESAIPTDRRPFSPTFTGWS
jgi:antitoxin (DNA-binding transcriptional repressor) of toxin-antitoxin stability system